MLSPLNLPFAVVRAIDKALRRVDEEEQRIKAERGRRKRLKALLAFARPSRSRATHLREPRTQNHTTADSLQPQADSLKG
jgi:hypothetical protein